MSYGTRKAIAGTERGVRDTADAVTEAIRKYDACRTVADVQAVLAWARSHTWFWITRQDDISMRAAFEAARQRVQP